MKNKLKYFKNKFSPILLELREKNFSKIIHAIKSRIKARIFGYPTQILIEPINMCNINCGLCSAPQQYITRKRLAMTFGNFKAIIDDIKSITHSIYLTNAGEPLLNKDIFKMIKYASKLGLSVSVSTNATLLDKKAILELLDSGLDSLIVSVDGAAKYSYEKFRRGAVFEEVIRNITELCHEKKRFLKNKPFVELQCIVTRYNENEQEEMKRLSRAMGVDRLHFKTLSLCPHVYGIDVRKKFAEEFLPRRNDVKNRYVLDNDGAPLSTWSSDTCSYWKKLSVILVDGTVCMCCYDINGEYCFGNVNEASFRQIWNSEKYRHYRNDLMFYKKLPLCKNCDL